MKKLFTIILIIAGMLSAQEFEVVSYGLDQLSIAPSTSEILDDSGFETGLLKIYSPFNDIFVHSNRGVVHIDRDRPGEVWVYLSGGERNIKISREGFSPFEFNLVPSIDRGRVYTLRLRTSGHGNVMDRDMHRILFRLNEAGVSIAQSNFAPMPVSGRAAEYRLPKGEHEFSFYKEGFVDKKEKITVDSDREIEIAMVQGSNFTKLSLPSIVTVTSDPSGADIFLNNQSMGKTPQQFDLRPGEYSLVIRNQFFHDYSGSFSLKEGEALRVPEIKLKPRHAYYTAKAEPKGARIYLDGALLGEGPFKKTKIESGTHIFTAELDLYHSETRTVEFNDGDELDVNFVLKQNFGRLNLDSEPQGASVYIGGREVGKTPYSADRMKSGLYRIRMSKDLWSDYEDQIEIEDGKETRRTFPLSRNFGTLKVRAAGSEIFVNGKKEGNESFQANLKPGQYEVVAKRPKHRDAKRDVFINIGTEADFELKPDPIQGSVSIISEPIETSGAKIFLNGKESGKTPAVMSLLIGDYKMRLEAGGYLDKSEDFSLTEGESKVLRIQMQTYEGSQKEKRDFWRKQKWYSLGAFALSAGAGSYFYVSGNNYYDDYQNADYGKSSTSEVEDLRQSAITADKYRDISFSVSLAPLGYFFYSWYKDSSYK